MNMPEESRKSETEVEHMEILQKDKFVFRVDLQKTRAYYNSNSLCNCCGCRNLYAQISTLSASLTGFLSDFGIDICRPDEAAYVEGNNAMEYLFVGYTAIGSIDTEGIFETDIEDFHIKISRGDTPFDRFPNEQTEPCFFVTVTGITLPWVLDEPFPRE